MSRLERRPTVARNFLCGDRRSVALAMEHWMNIEPPVSRVTLTGSPAHVLGTALGLHDLGAMHGLARSPFAPELRSTWDALDSAGITTRQPLQALHALLGADQVTGLREGDVLLVVDPQGLSRSALAAVTRALAQRPVPLVLVTRPADALPAALRRLDAHVIPTALQCPAMASELPGILEELDASRVVLAGAGQRLLGTGLGVGDVFLERCAQVPDAPTMRRLLADHVALLEDAVAPPKAWTGLRALASGVAAFLGARLVDAQATDMDVGVVMEPLQGPLSRAA
jgi:hypothetical protein